MPLNSIISAIKDAKNIALLPHVSADGDALGSCLALNIALKKMDKKVTVFIEEEIPFIYSFLPEAKTAKLYRGEVGNFDLVMAIDTGDLGRLGERIEIFNGARITVNIDHHHTNSEFAFHNHVEPNSSAAGEIIYQLIKTMGLGLDADISTCLYVAIASDTGGFRYSNTTPITHQIVADLIKNGVNVTEISQRIFDSVSYAKVRLMGVAINSLELLERGKVSIIVLSDEMIKNVGAKEEDCDGVVNIGRNILGVEVSVVMKIRQNGEIKISLRSKAYVDVSAIAGMYSGGGHKRAAGCTVQGKIEDIREKLLIDIRELL